MPCSSHPRYGKSFFSLVNQSNLLQFIYPKLQCGVNVLGPSINQWFCGNHCNPFNDLFGLQCWYCNTKARCAKGVQTDDKVKRDRTKTIVRKLTCILFFFSNSTRGWLISPFKNHFWWWLIAFFPALLGVILIFMDQQITAVIVNRKENKLKKGCGYHLDLFVLAILIQICTTFGLPW